MGRAFVAASSQYLEVDSTPATAVPLTISCWFQVTSVAAATDWALMNIPNSGTASDYFMLEVYQGDLYCVTRQGGNNAESATTGAPVTINTWHHAVGVFSATNTRVPYLNGTAGTDLSSITATPSGANRISVGRRGISTGSQLYLDGRLAEPAIWTAALSAAEVLLLAQGMSPTAVAPASLVFYAPIDGVASPERDLIGARNLTVTGATATNHPFIRIPRAVMAPPIAA